MWKIGVGEAFEIPVEISVHGQVAGQSFQMKMGSKYLRETLHNVYDINLLTTRVESASKELQWVSLKV